jgi:hypothetical protein
LLSWDFWVKGFKICLEGWNRVFSLSFVGFAQSSYRFSYLSFLLPSGIINKFKTSQNSSVINTYLLFVGGGDVEVEVKGPVLSRYSTDGAFLLCLFF